MTGKTVDGRLWSSSTIKPRFIFDNEIYRELNEQRDLRGGVKSFRGLYVGKSLIKNEKANRARV